MVRPLQINQSVSLLNNITYNMSIRSIQKRIFRMCQDMHH
jgi:hypothetical protein